MASTTLYLTAAERGLYEKLPETVRNGWTLEEEKGSFTDTERRRSIRIRLMKIRDPELQKMLTVSSATESPEAFVKRVTAIDPQDINEVDLREIFFAVGPNVMSTIIAGLLGTAKSDQDVEGVARFSEIRHHLYLSYQAVA